MNALQNAYFYLDYPPQDVNSTTAFGTTGIDLGGSGAVGVGGYSDLCCIIQFGNVAAALDAQPKIEHSTDNSTWVDVTGATFTATLGAATHDNKIMIGNIKTGGALRRYVRAYFDCGAGATLLSVLWVGLNPGDGINGATEIARGVAAGALDRFTVSP